MKIFYLVFRPKHHTYTILKALSFCGHTISLHVADRNYDLNSVSTIISRIIAIPGVSVISGDQDILPSDRCIIETTPHLLNFISNSTVLTKLTQKISLISTGDRNYTWYEAQKLQWKEIWQLKRLLNYVDRIVYKDGYYQKDCYGFFKPRYVLGFDVHSQFVHYEELFKEINNINWKVDSTRPNLVNFIGSQDSDNRRRQIVDSVRPLFSTPGQIDGPSKSWFWHEYSDAHPGGLDPIEFLDILRNSDFTLCPPGYTLVCHRPLEALLKGSIPILNENELDLYDIGFADGINCIAVPPNQWPATLEKLSTMDEEKIRTMRSNIQLMFDKFLTYKASSQRMCQRLGIAHVGKDIN